jgi:queuosine precursor transporter
MNELFWVLMVLINFAAILLLYRFFGRTGLFVWVPISVILANIQVLKTVELFGITTTLGNIVYATSFLVTDILSENYGKKDARRAVGLGFISLIAMTLIMNAAILFTPSAEDFAHEALKTIFSVMPRIAGASLAAYLLSQLHDIWAYHFWKKRFNDKKYIWIRNNASTFVSQLIDTIVFTFLAFLGTFPFPVVVQILWSTYIMKLLVAGLDTPLIYIARGWYDRKQVGGDDS